MAFGNKGGGSAAGLSILLLALAGLAGTCASLYAMIVAYLAGSSAQASIDGCPAADPMSLARASMAELGQSVAAQQDSGVIDVDEAAVHVKDVESDALSDGTLSQEEVA